MDTVGPLPLNDFSGNELIERRQAPAFDVGIVLEQATYRRVVRYSQS